VDKKHRFSPVGRNARLYRLKKAAVGAAFGIHDIGRMIDCFGASWEHHFSDILHPVNSFDPQGFFDDQRAALAELADRHQFPQRPPQDPEPEPRCSILDDIAFAEERQRRARAATIESPTG